MRKWLILCCALSMSSAGAAPAWTWTDENGTVHFSDRPVPGARQIELGGAQSIPAMPAPVPAPAPAPAPADTAAAQPYRTIAITSPVQQETLWNTAGILNVEIDLAPALRPGHVIDVYLDGERRNLNTTSTRVTLPEVWRGVHTLQAIVLDASGRELTRSLAVTFMVQQTSIQNPNNPNVPRLAPPQSLPGR
jgi:hypothetical protein